MKIGSLGEYETRIALRVLDFVAFGSITGCARDYEIVTGRTHQQFREAAWAILDMPREELRAVVNRAMFFAVGGYPHRHWKRMEEWCGASAKELTRIWEKFSDPLQHKVVRAYVSHPPTRYQGEIYRGLGYVREDGFKRHALQVWSGARWKPVKGGPLMRVVAEGVVLVPKEVQEYGLDTSGLPEGYDPRVG